MRSLLVQHLFSICNKLVLEMLNPALSLIFYANYLQIELIGAGNLCQLARACCAIVVQCNNQINSLLSKNKAASAIEISLSDVNRSFLNVHLMLLRWKEKKSPTHDLENSQRHANFATMMMKRERERNYERNWECYSAKFHFHRAADVAQSIRPFSRTQTHPIASLNCIYSHDAS